MRTLIPSQMFPLAMALKVILPSLFKGEPMLTPQRHTGRKQAKRVKNAKPKKAERAQQEDNSTYGDSDSAAEQQLSKDLWKEGVKTGLGPGKEVFIEKPKARDPGSVPYRDDTLHPNTKLFLKDLVQNNERVWFKGNRYHPSSLSNSVKTDTSTP